jgi:hypothetical protein
MLDASVGFKGYKKKKTMKWRRWKRTTERLAEGDGEKHVPAIPCLA